MNKVDVFLSYEHNMKSVVDHICSVLEAEGIRCWYAPRDVSGDYATSIVNAIDEASIFVVVLNNAASKSVHVLNEVEIAYKRIIEKEGELTILPFKLDGEDLSKAMEYYIKRLHWIDASTQGIENAILELKTKILTILKPAREHGAAQQERHSNAYYEESDEKERARLLIQQRLLEKFDGELYDAVAAERENMYVLDLGSANGSFAMSRFGSRKNLAFFLGTEFNGEAVERANAAYGNDHIVFTQCDLEGEDVEKVIGDVCEKYGIDGFNVVNISMLILHLKNPVRLLKRIRKFVRSGATIVIKDIDDGLNLAYPDREGHFEYAVGLCAKNPLGGFRASGRQIPYLLRKSGYRDIRLVRSGLNTLDMDFDEREAMFHIYFSFIRGDFAYLAAQSPDNALYRESAEWMQKHYEEMEDEFMNEDFFFSLGFMLYTAKK